MVSAVKRSSAQREAEEAAAQDAASVITETEAAYSSLTYDNGSATLSFHLDEAGKWVWSDARPLSELTEGIHLHTLSCPDEAAFGRVCRELRRLGVLLEG